MTEQLPAAEVRRENYYDAFNTPAELPSTQPEGALAVTLNPLAIYLRNEGQWVPLASVAGNIPAPTVVNASETAAGIAELATQEETDAGSDAFRIVTPARLSGRTATEARTGLVELATTTETLAGTDVARAVHPAGLKAATSPGAWITPTLQGAWVAHGAGALAPGYCKDAAGFVHLRGSVKGGADATTVFTLPLGYRPEADAYFAVDGAGTAPSKVVAHPDGRVEAFVVAGNTRFSLNGVYFKAA